MRSMKGLSLSGERDVYVVSKNILTAESGDIGTILNLKHYHPDIMRLIEKIKREK